MKNALKPQENKMTMRRTTTAILPTSTRLNPKTPDGNMFHADWGKGTYLLLEQHQYEKKSRQIILFGSGDPGGYPEIGSKIDAHHDQSSAQLGRWTVVAKAPHSRVSSLSCGAKPLYVYK
jgi:hypothetical protein